MAVVFYGGENREVKPRPEEDGPEEYRSACFLSGTLPVSFFLTKRSGNCRPDFISKEIFDCNIIAEIRAV